MGVVGCRLIKMATAPKRMEAEQSAQVTTKKRETIPREKRKESNETHESVYTNGYNTMEIKMRVFSIASSPNPYTERCVETKMEREVKNVHIFMRRMQKCKEKKKEKMENGFGKKERIIGTRTRSRTRATPKWDGSPRSTYKMETAE